MQVRPQGTVTFVFTDIVGSTRLWERFPAAMGAAIRVHDDIAQRTFSSHGGFVFKTVGDAFCVAFEEPGKAIRAGVAFLRALAAESWGETGPLAVRTGIHSGPAELRGDDYFGGTLNRVARIEAAAHGGQILVSRVTVELVHDDPPPGVSFRDLGEHRLRSLERPENISQVLAGGLQEDFPPPRSMEVLPNNLPAQTTSFIGREKEMDAVLASLPLKTRLLTLVGTGGTGKTRLSMEAGARLIGTFPDGVWFVELAPVSDASRILSSVTEAIGVREEPGRPLHDTLIDALRGKRILLILDNCEHLAGAVASLVTEILRSSPQLCVLATSRHALSVPGEAVLPVPPLGIFDVRRHDTSAPGFAESLSQYDSVKLFIERALYLRHDFALTNANAPAVAEICSRLDGIPLAIELAAARVKLLDVAQIAARLGDRFRLLRGSDVARLPHQQTLKALIDWSHDLLSEPEQVLFRRLGVFIVGRSLDAIEAVCSGGEVDELEVLDLLQGLVEKSLVSVEEGTVGMRYTLIESVWHYARTRLAEAGEEETLRDRHMQFFLQWSERASPEFEGPEQKRWINEFNDEIFNLEAAVTWTIERGLSEEGVRFLAALGRAFEVRAFLSQARTQAGLILAAGAGVRPALLAPATAAAARLAWTLDLYPEARSLFERATALALEASNEVLAALCNSFLGFLDRGEGRIAEAERRFTEGHEASKRLNDPRLRALCVSGLGRIAMSREDFTTARALCEEGVSLYRSLGDLWVTGLVLWGLARAATAQGDLDRAKSALCEWAGIVESLGNTWSLPYIIEAFADVALAAEQGEKAALLFGGAEAQRERFGIVFAPNEEGEHSASIEKLRDLVDPDTLQKFWDAGRVLSPADLVSRARESSCPRANVAP